MSKNIKYPNIPYKGSGVGYVQTYLSEDLPNAVCIVVKENDIYKYVRISTADAREFACDILDAADEADLRSSRVEHCCGCGQKLTKAKPEYCDICGQALPKE